ncbi:MAG: hypothetical protein ACI38U_14150 [Corynebacterium sp.]|uniref:hypothetical protein n=1 Tax=Corynebacterium sp. TaxID=1720 RepID=UPI003F019503
MTPDGQPEGWQDVAEIVLARGKMLAPDRFPAPSADAAEAWAGIIQSLNLPWQVWPEAVTWWSLNVKDDRMITPKALKDAAWVVRDKWEADPEKKKILDQNWVNRLLRKAEQGVIPPASVPPVGAMPQQALEPRSDGTAKRWKEIREGIAQRARDRRIAEREAAGSGELFADMNKQPGESPEDESR